MSLKESDHQLDVKQIQYKDYILVPSETSVILSGPLITKKTLCTNNPWSHKYDLTTMLKLAVVFTLYSQRSFISHVVLMTTTRNLLVEVLDSYCTCNHGLTEVIIPVPFGPIMALNSLNGPIVCFPL